MLEYGSDLHVNERQKIRYYRARSTEEERQMAIFFFTSRNLVYSQRSSVQRVSYASRTNSSILNYTIDTLPVVRISHKVVGYGRPRRSTRKRNKTIFCIAQISVMTFPAEIAILQELRIFVLRGLYVSF